MTRPPRRWHRAMIPLAVAAALLVGTAIAYETEQPDPADAAFLSPVRDEDIGARRLADLVRGRGVAVQRDTRITDALLAAAESDGATLLIPAPTMVHREYLRVLHLLPAGTRVVLIEPQAAALRQGRLPVTPGPRRLATAVRPPSAGAACDQPFEAAAAVTRQRYGPVGTEAVEQDRCFDDGLVVLRRNGVELVLVGSSDPFRNDRIGEHGNAAVAVELLTSRPQLIWLDQHEVEPPPVDPSAGGPPGIDPTRRPDREGESGEGSSGDDGSGGDGSGRGQSGRGDRAGSGSGDDNPLARAAPPWFWALLAQLALAALLVALWRARRLGPPVAEPLPVTVRSAETVRGRGRLYQRARARGPALDILRAAARTRLSALLRLPPDAGPGELVAAVAAQTGRAPDEVEALLTGPPPENDEDLVRMASELDALMHGLTAAGPERGEEQR